MPKILVAEDDKFLSKAYSVKLTTAGFEFKVVADGNEVLETLKTYKPDLILLDLIMPNKDGFEVLESLARDQTLSKIPVIVVSNLGQQEDIDRAKKLGAKEFIVKSDVPLSQLIEKITLVIDSQKSSKSV